MPASLSWQIRHWNFNALAPRKQNKGRRQHKRVTATDVARRAGVSPMTVSRVVNGDGRVRESTRVAVQKAIRDLGYQPNKAARSLASANPIRIGLIYTNPNSTYLSSMMLGVMDQARQSDTQIVVIECQDGPDAVGIVTGLIEGGVDGLILAPPLCDSESIFRTLKHEAVPAVTVGSQHRETHISSVFINDFGAAQAMTRHVISLGHRRVAFIVGEWNQSASRLRLAGYQEALAEAGLTPADELVYQGEFSYRSGFKAAEQLLMLDDPPTALVASNDDMAAGAIATAYRRNLEVPRDLTVCGFDDSLMATTIWPEITTVRQPISEMSRVAIDLLERHIRRRRSGLETDPERIELDFKLVMRNSDAPPRGMAEHDAERRRSDRIARRYSSASARKPPAF
jgi:LacI family transcriptional regulator